MPCDHGVAAIIAKHGSANVHKFIDPRLLSKAWKDLYKDTEFKLPPQVEIDAVILDAKQRVVSGEALLGPKALAPPRGNPGTKIVARARHRV